MAKEEENKYRFPSPTKTRRMAGELTNKPGRRRGPINNMSGSKQLVVFCMRETINRLWRKFEDDLLNIKTVEQAYCVLWLVTPAEKRRSLFVGRDVALSYLILRQGAGPVVERPRARAIEEAIHTLGYEGIPVRCVSDGADGLKLESLKDIAWRIASEYIANDVPIGKENALSEITRVIRKFTDVGLFNKEVASMLSESAEQTCREAEQALEEIEEEEAAEASPGEEAPATPDTSSYPGYNPETFDPEDPLKDIDPEDPYKGINFGVGEQLQHYMAIQAALEAAKVS